MEHENNFLWVWFICEATEISTTRTCRVRMGIKSRNSPSAGPPSNLKVTLSLDHG